MTRHAAAVGLSLVLLIGGVAVGVAAQGTSPASQAGLSSRYRPAALPEPGQFQAAGDSVALRLTDQDAQSAPQTSGGSSAMLGQPVEAREIAQVEGSDDFQDGHHAVSPAGGMRSVLKRSRGPIINEVAPPSFATPEPEPVPAEPSGNAYQLQSPLTAPQNAPTGVSSRRSFPSATMPSPATEPAADSPAPAASSRRPVVSGESFQRRSIQDLALVGHMPAIRVEVAGPQSVTAGKNAAFVVNLYNDSDVPAQQVQLRGAVPTTTTITVDEASAGNAAVRSDAPGVARLVWTIPALEPKAHHTLRLHLTATTAEPFELAFEWIAQPAAMRATILVHQPKLELVLGGPAEINFGEEKVFTVTVSNPGTGDAENVAVAITSGSAPPQQVDVGLVPAGMQKEVAVQVVGNQPGEMHIRAVADADGGLHSEAAGKVLVRKAELAVHIEGPQITFAGIEALYEVTVANVGNASADSIAVTATLPNGCKYLGGIDGAAAKPTEIKWSVPALPAGAERSFALRLQLNAMGTNHLAVRAQNGAGIAATGQLDTEVEAVSDIKLTVNDPTVPVAVGDDAVYEIQIANRGTKAANQVRVVVQFSEGIEPSEVEGLNGRIVPGQVVCEPIPQLGAGEKMVVKVHAKADRGGTHQYRVELTSTEADMRFVSEGTTRFFSDNARGGAFPATARKPSLLPQPGIPAGLQR